MELIAASQIAKAQSRIAANRPFRDGMARLMQEIVAGDPVLAKTLFAAADNVESVAVVAIVGDRGLSGAYNSNVLRATERHVAALKSNGVNVRLFAVGKKATNYFRFRGIATEEVFTGFADRPVFADARTVASAVLAPYFAGEVQELHLVSTTYLSSATQRVDNRVLLPLSAPEAQTTSGTLKGYTEFEPELSTLVAGLVRIPIESEIFTALLEGAASFHTSQQRAMAAATENADELNRVLTRVMNQARQASITTEIMEIVGGAEALRSGK
jgi:F-type H+-transporting ATPase subunit gamma